MCRTVARICTPRSYEIVGRQIAEGIYTIKHSPLTMLIITATTVATSLVTCGEVRILITAIIVKVLSATSSMNNEIVGTLVEDLFRARSADVAKHVGELVRVI